jgi:broad specificity phosphatase PhoE
MLTIIFESHATSLDNENHIASGHFDVELSQLGIEQSKELGQRYANKLPTVIFCSDLQRSYKTAEIAFSQTGIKIIKDPRLRECNYGDLTQKPSQEIESQRGHRISTPFPNGESYEQTTERIKEFLRDVYIAYDRGTVLVIGHRATQYGLEHLLNGMQLEKTVSDPWRWQPGWIYYMKRNV